MKTKEKTISPFQMLQAAFDIPKEITVDDADGTRLGNNGIYISDFIDVMERYAAQAENVSPIYPNDLRVKEKAFESLKSNEYDTYNNPEELFVAGAIWMRKILIGK